jgi:hypothetical protein
MGVSTLAKSGCNGGKADGDRCCSVGAACGGWRGLVGLTVTRPLVPVQELGTWLGGWEGRLSGEVGTKRGRGVVMWTEGAGSSSR